MERIAEPDSLMLDFGKALPRLILASSSPNRRALLEKAGCSVSVFVPDADEAKRGNTPEDIVSGIAKRKMEAYLASSSYDPEMAAIAADTLVLIEGALLGKPRDREDAERMLKGLSGHVQTVISAAGLKLPGHDPVMITDKADVVFRNLSPKEVGSYLDTGEWQGAAGGYRLQKTGYTLIDRIDGDWTTVVGLPLRAILDTLRNTGEHRIG